MSKISDCDRCLFGVDDESCLDFREDPNASSEELWEPEGASYYNGELILQSKRRLTPEQQWQILETHPLFTGHCPSCGYQFPCHVPELVHFDCPSCGWIDDSV